MARKSKFIPSTLHNIDSLPLELDVEEELSVEAETPSYEVDPADNIDDNLRNHIVNI